MKAIAIDDLQELAYIGEALNSVFHASDRFYIGFGPMDVLDINDKVVGTFVYDDDTEQVVFQAGKVRQ